MAHSLVQHRTNLGCALLLIPFLLGGYLLAASQLLPRGQAELLCRQQARRELGGVVLGLSWSQDERHARLRLLVPASPSSRLALPRLEQVGCAVVGSGAGEAATLEPGR